MKNLSTEVDTRKKIEKPWHNRVVIVYSTCVNPGISYAPLKLHALVLTEAAWPIPIQSTI
jgi:hypothetical protein